MFRFIAFISALFLFHFVSAQTPADWWFFGNHAGMHFTGTGPVAVAGGAFSTSEGCASISDNQGNLLFYTDGQGAYDKNHNQMPNGSGLLGAQSSTHSAVIVPKPGSNDLFYLFTVDDGGTAGVGMYYSLVDMTLNGGDGDVVTSEKNVFLADSTSEKIVSVKKSNGYWVVTHITETDKFEAFAITAAGVNTTPMISYSGLATSGFGFGVKPSTSGDQIAAVHHTIDSIFLYDFDLSSGMVTGGMKIGSSIAFGAAYGVEFSPNEDILYIAPYSSGQVHQFDLTQGTSAAISASEVVLGTGNNGGMLQLGPDKKIYCARVGRPYLSVIHDPNVLGTSANWQDTAVVLTSGTNSNYGLPTFIQSFFNASITVNQFCFEDATQFSVDTAGVDSVFWNFGEPSSGTDDTSTAFFPTHEYADTGSYTVTLIAYSDTLIDTVVQSIFIYPRQSVDLGSDTVFCSSVDSVAFTSAQPYASFLWHNGSTEDSVWIDTNTHVWVTVFGVCDTVSDSVLVQWGDSIGFDLGPDTLLCAGESYVLDANVQVNATYLWNTGDTLDSITVTSSDVYVFSATNLCGTTVDSVEVTFRPIPGDSMLPADTLNCFDNEIVLVRPGEPDVTYYWSDSSSKTTYTVDTTETVWLAASNECGFSIDTINIVFNGEILSELGEDTAICEGDSIALTAIHPGASYVWNTGEVSDTIWTDQVETFNYVVTITYKDCKTIESKRVDMDDFYCPPIDCSMQYANSFSPNNDGVNDKFRPWSDCDIYSFSMYIYNRWGQLVHSDKHVQFGWDGFINGQPAPEGVYYFVIDFHDRVVVDEDRNIYQGSFTILR